jgi:hypothetical protein
MDWIFNLPPRFELLMVIFNAAIIACIVIIPIAFFPRWYCLKSDAPRRWISDDGYCEEYQDGQWIKVNDAIIYYNESAMIYRDK